MNISIFNRILKYPQETPAPHTNNRDLSRICKTFPTAHSMESAEQSPLSTKHPSVLPTHPPNIILAAAKLNLRPGFYNHRQSFNHRDKANATELSKTVWKYKDKGINRGELGQLFANHLHIPAALGAATCCVAEKLAILQVDQRTLLNKQSEFVSKC